VAEDKQSYQNVIKATSLFGSVQIFRILVTIIRSKVMAFLLGPEGVGIANLLGRPLQLITTATQLGLDKSAVKEISTQNNLEEGNPFVIIAILKRLLWITAFIGAGVMIVFSSFLSQFTFDSDAYRWAFVWLGIAVVFNQFAMGHLAILQGLRKLKLLAKANIYGSLAGLIAAIPLYYYFEIDGILPAIIITSGCIFLFAYIYARKITREHISLVKGQVATEGKSMVRLGMALSFSSLLGLLVAYLILVYIRSKGGEVEAGFYAAGMAILNTYVGLIFNAMSTDYYPRLAAICDDLLQVVKTVFEQAFVAILLITPIVIVFIAFAPLLIRILYSSEFDPTVVLIQWGIIGMVFKAVSWSIGYVIIAKGDSSLFVKTSIGFNILLLALNVAGYYYLGLEGLGISLIVYFVIHFFVIKMLVLKRYNFKMKAGFHSIFIKCLLLCAIAFLACYIPNPLLKYSVLVIVIVLSMRYSYRLLNEKVGFKVLMDSILKKKK